MEKKPLKRDPNLLQLSRDHHDGLLFCWKLREGVRYGAESARIAPYVQYFWKQHLHHHFDEEEQFLFAEVQDNLVRKAMDDHQEIRHMIAQITADPLPALFTRLAELLGAHIRFEERQLFPHLEKILGKQELAEIGKKLALANESKKDDFPDQFWVMGK